VILAKDADVVVVVGGLTPEWESEGFDRPSLAMPGLQDELIAAVAAVNPNVVVVIQAVSGGMSSACLVLSDRLRIGVGGVNALGR